MFFFFHFERYDKNRNIKKNKDKTKTANNRMCIITMHTMNIVNILINHPNNQLSAYLTQLSHIYSTHLWCHSDHTFTVMLLTTPIVLFSFFIQTHIHGTRTDNTNPISSLFAAQKTSFLTIQIHIYSHYYLCFLHIQIKLLQLLCQLSLLL